MEGQEDNAGQGDQTQQTQEGQNQSQGNQDPQAAAQAAQNQEPKVPQDIDKFRDKVRMEERTKLQSQLDRAAALEDKAAAVSSENEALKSRLADLEKGSQPEPDKKEPEPTKSKSKTEDVDARIEAATTEVATKLTEKFTSQMEAMKTEHASETASLRETLRQKDLAEYRAAKLQEAQGQIIEELVTGNTEQEIDDSYAKARSVWQKTVDSVNGQETQQTGPPPPNGGPPPAAGPGTGHGEFQPGVADADSAMAAKVRSMSPEEFAASRGNLKAELRRRHPNQ